MSMETFSSNQMDTWSDLRRDKETICIEVRNIIFQKQNDHDAVELRTTNPNKEKRRNHW